MAKAKTKPLLPSLREKKRYLAYEVISGHKFNDAVDINKAIMDAAKDFLGNLGMAKAGIIAMDDQFSQKSQKGIIRVNNKHLDKLRASLLFVEKINENDAIIKSVGASGVLKKAQQKYLN